MKCQSCWSGHCNYQTEPEIDNFDLNVFNNKVTQESKFLFIKPKPKHQLLMHLKYLPVIKRPIVENIPGWDMTPHFVDGNMSRAKINLLSNKIETRELQPPRHKNVGLDIYDGSFMQQNFDSFQIPR